jgi:cobyrinic acid a,c-diamide synthase
MTPDRAVDIDEGPPGVVLAGTRSGIGKTVATLAVLEALQRAGYTVQPAKAGPDFIDPSHHAVVADRPSRTLDPWLTGEAGLRRNYARGEGDVCVVEGVMGLYDGSVSSTAMVAADLDLPVVLVVDANAGMESVAATALGFRAYAATIDRDVDVVGVLAQRAHAGRHADGIRDALPEGLEFLGHVPPDDALEIPDRHLGLHRGEEAPLARDALADAAAHLDVEALIEVARPARVPTQPASQREPPSGEAPRVAVASDPAFCFTYPATRERLRERAEVVTFAPTAGDDLPPCDAVYLPGGYPELHAEALAESPALATLADRAAEGLPVLGECGGFMALGESLTTTDGETHEMAGVLPAAVTMAEHYQALDHVELAATRLSPTAAPDDRLRGHEFHYSGATVGADARFAFEVTRGDGIAEGQDGLLEYATLGTYAHVHAESGAFDTLIARAAERRD